MILGVDIGNTQTKIAVYKGDKLDDVFFCSTEIFHEKLLALQEENPLFKTVILASVVFLKEFQLEILKKHFVIEQITRQSKMPFKNNYQTPNTLGIDRMVLASGGSLLYPNENVLIIDAGTCITYDFVNENNVYYGGGISPGIQLRFRSLHHFTAKLPEVKWENQEVNLIGKTTNESIESGVINGAVEEINGIINKYLQQNEKLRVILTGGDAEYLSKQIKNVIFAKSFFLLESLYLLHKYIKSND